MKTIFLLSFLAFFSVSFSQNYKLLPDSCSYCSYGYTMGGSSIYYSYYELSPFNDTIINGDHYMRNTVYGDDTTFIRQVGDKVVQRWGVDPTEYVIMDFEHNIGDTIFNLFDRNIYYNAVVLDYDSTLVSGGSGYSRFFLLNAYNDINSSDSWGIKWEERGVCNYTYSNFEGGLGYNITHETEYYSFHPIGFCTSDPLVNSSFGLSCNNCTFQSALVNEIDDKIISISPNPFVNKISFDMDYNGALDVNIFDINGILMFEKKILNNEKELFLGKLEKGVYFIEITTGNRIFIKKIIKI